MAMQRILQTLPIGTLGAAPGKVCVCVEVHFDAFVVHKSDFVGASGMQDKTPWKFMYQRL